MNLQFNIETVAETKDDIATLIDLHYEELCAHKNVIKLAPDFDRYQLLEDMGKLAIFTVRDTDLLIGYSIFFVDSHIHYNNDVFANNDIIFLHKDYRNPFTVKRWLLSWTRRMLMIPKRSKGIGEQLIDFSEEQLRHMRVTKVIWHIKFKLNWFPILARRGYAREDFTATKIL
jgi:hypothetical protein